MGIFNTSYGRIKADEVPPESDASNAIKKKFTAWSEKYSQRERIPSDEYFDGLDELGKIREELGALLQKLEPKAGAGYAKRAHSHTNAESFAVAVDGATKQYLRVGVNVAPNDPAVKSYLTQALAETFDNLRGPFSSSKSTAMVNSGQSMQASAGILKNKSSNLASAKNKPIQQPRNKPKTVNINNKDAEKQKKIEAARRGVKNQNGTVVPMSIFKIKSHRSKDCAKVVRYNKKPNTLKKSGLQADHMPSKVDLNKAAENYAKQNNLTLAQTKKLKKLIYNNSPTVLTPTDIHYKGPTYGSKNKRQSNATINDLKSISENEGKQNFKEMQKVDSPCGKKYKKALDELKQFDWQKHFDDQLKKVK
jgi:hypothetical protein